MLNILMGVFDFVPVVAFLIAGIILQRCLYNKMSKGAFALYSAGIIIVFCAGFLKAVHKILFYLGVCDFEVLKTSFFLNQTLGFFLLACGLVAMLCHKQGPNKAYAIVPMGVILADFVAPEVFSGTMLFVVLMVLGVAVSMICYCILAVKIKKPIIILPLVISLFFILGMGYLSTKDDMSDWIKEFVNTVGQGLLLLSAILLKKNGLDKAEL